jgi:hypothetical protein
MQKRARFLVRSRHPLRRVTKWIVVLAIAWMSAAGLTGAFDVTCGVEAVAQVTRIDAQNGPQGTSA